MQAIQKLTHSHSRKLGLALRNPTLSAFVTSIMESIRICEVPGTGTSTPRQPSLSKWRRTTRCEGAGDVPRIGHPTDPYAPPCPALCHRQRSEDSGDWLVTGQVVPMNPAAAVRGPKHVVKIGKTPVLDATEWPS